MLDSFPVIALKNYMEGLRGRNKIIIDGWWEQNGKLLQERKYSSNVNIAYFISDTEPVFGTFSSNPSYTIH